MSKPREETWIARGHCGIDSVEEFPDEVGMMHGGRNVLAAAAPEMARLLLTRVDNTDSGKDDMDWYCFACGQGGGHLSACRLIAVLHKAGVMK